MMRMILNCTKFREYWRMHDTPRSPIGVEVADGKLWKLKKSLGFYACFKHTSGGRLAIIALYADDVIIAMSSVTIGEEVQGYTD